MIFEFGPLWQLALAAPVGLYGLANAAVLSAGGVGSLLAPRLTLAKPASILGVAGLLVGSSLALVVVRNTVIVILAQGVLVAGGVGISMIFTRLLHDSLSSRVRAGAASGVSALSSLAFVLFALLFGMVSQHVGIFSRRVDGGWGDAASQRAAGQRGGGQSLQRLERFTRSSPAVVSLSTRLKGLVESHGTNRRSQGGRQQDALRGRRSLAEHL